MPEASHLEPQALAGVPLALSHQGVIDTALKKLSVGLAEHCLSEFSFANLYLFKREHDYRFADGPWPHITGRTYGGVRHVLPLFFLADAPPAVLQQLLAGQDCFYPLAEVQTRGLGAAFEVLGSSRDDADYLYPADNFRHYRGTALNKKRNLMKQLLTAHTVTAQPYGPALEAQALEVLAGWMQDKGKSAGDADETPCLEALAHAQTLGLQGFVYFVDNAPAGFLLAEALATGVFVMRFAKSLHQFKGLAQYMFHHFCVAFPQPVNWLNFEQDLGLENFRLTKQSYQPAALLQKYRVSLVR